MLHYFKLPSRAKKIDAVKWHRRASILYGFAAWTFVGYIVWFCKKDNHLPEGEKEERTEDDIKSVKKYSTALTEITVIHRENSVQYRTAFLNPFKSKTEDSAESSNEDKASK